MPPQLLERFKEMESELLSLFFEDFSFLLSASPTLYRCVLKLYAIIDPRLVFDFPIILDSFSC